MSVVDADRLPVGLVRVDDGGKVIASNLAFREWAESGHPEGRPLSDFLVPVNDFMDAGRIPEMMARPDRPNRAAFVIASGDQTTFIIMDASERYAAGNALRAARSLADRTQRRLQLVIDSSIAFAQATTEKALAEILATTAAQAYGAEDATVYLHDPERGMWRAAGSNPFEQLSDLGSNTQGALNLRQVVKVSGEAQAKELSVRLAELMQATNVHAILSAPLHLEGGLLGVFACFFHHPRKFDDEATPLAEALAGQAAQALFKLRLQHQFEYAATHDVTTGLPNRRRLEEVGVVDAQRSVAVMFIDLDGFKAVNDVLGHQRGDDLLREVAQRLQATVREDDVVIRYGGDEFVIICDVKAKVSVGDMADRIRDALRAPYPGLPSDLRISASVGIATGGTRHGNLPIDNLIRAADQAMYEAKLDGGNQVVQR
jgi:diguanylate cyclase (GGDEF)-like protein